MHAGGGTAQHRGRPSFAAPVRTFFFVREALPGLITPWIHIVAPPRAQWRNR